MEVPQIELTAADMVNLRWMARVNPDGVGLFGPTLRKYGPVPECQRLVEAGLATRDDGYWITEAGVAAIRQSKERS